MTKPLTRKTAGFTLMEMLLYVGLVIIVVSSIVIFGRWAIQTGSKIKSGLDVMDNARRAMEIMAYEIKTSRSVYTPTSIFDANFGQLSLEQLAINASETTTFTDFFKCGDWLCLKRDGAGVIVLTNDRIKVTKLIFHRLLNSDRQSSIQIELGVESVGEGTYGSAIELITTANLRAY